MPVHTLRGKRKVAFPNHHVLKTQIKTTAGSSSQAQDSQQSTVLTMSDQSDIELLANYKSSIPAYLLEPPILKNQISTPTSSLQLRTIDECLPFLNGLNNPSLRDFTPFDYCPSGILNLLTDNHIAFLHENLSEFPGAFVGLDASRPWMVYWALLSLHFLGEDVTVFRDQIIKTFFPLQNPNGGYGGGQGHLSHLAGTYATLLSLALVGGEEAWGLTDRNAMWKWLGRLKQADGGFRICEGGEEDVRGAYCALVAISLLGLPWELPADAPARKAGCNTFGDGLAEYLKRCQTYEGGISAAPGNEAHGAYAFCAIACLCLLDRPDLAIERCMDVEALLGWLSSRQYAPEGGLAGRTNKVVDGCYSHWLGGCWPLVLGALNGPKSSPMEKSIGNLYSTEGLARYILNCCQNPDGGLRDKPSKRPDSYHTCYTLAGISTTEHYHYFSESKEDDHFASAFAWSAIPQRERQAGSHNQPSSMPHDEDFDSDCRLNSVHPVFVIPHEAAIEMRKWAVQQERLFQE